MSVALTFSNDTPPSAAIPEFSELHKHVFMRRRNGCCTSRERCRNGLLGKVDRQRPGPDGCAAPERIPALTDEVISITTPAFRSSRSAPRNSCVSARCHHRTIRMSIATWATRQSTCAPIARRSIATTPRWRPTRRAQRNANCTTTSPSDFMR